MDLSSQSDESRVLIIYTGGTIGMLVGPSGYRNEPYFLTETLRCQSRFHDPLEDSLFSNSASVEGYRKWSNSGRTTPVRDEFTPVTVPSATLPLSMLTIRSSRPIGVAPTLSPDNLTPRNVHTECTQISEDVYEAQLPSLVTPRSSAHGKKGKRIRYAILEWNPLLDSSNIDTDDWIGMATEIELNYATFDAFVILHGTDTMSYTSSALSFLLEDLGKTVILTGAQIPLSQLRNDAIDNLLGALTIAGHYIIPECCLFFNHTLYRGNRVSKSSSYDLNAFSSPNFRPLVNVGIDIVVNWNDVIRQTNMRRFKAHKTMTSHVATLRLFPGITADTVRAFLTPPLKGVVLETFGAGNAPQRADLMSALSEACERGVVIVAISQCAKGSVSDAYETGRSLLQAGVVPGGDMTPECALTKLGYLLSKPELSVVEVRELIRTPLRGELTLPPGSAAAPSIGQNLTNIHDVLAQVVRLSSQPSHGGPQITVTSPSREHEEDAAAQWSWTAAEAASTESVLFPFLVHLAAAREDVPALRFCLESQVPSTPLGEGGKAHQAIAGGIVNCVDPSSGRSPLHVASLNGSEACVQLLLEAGALVHLRDSLGHTALYYAARTGHECIVETLRKAGGNLGGSDVEGGFASLAVTKAWRSGDEHAVRIWTKAGVDTSTLTIAQ
ncbi:asparaginase-domain-containing protein [Rickenella mellea]|uniref:asparaginase n=1 Tax=Rickenella mellea TaxID=50990 RepID=A0A4Y7QBT5_9AGAM|nr:asparaginase-domain-containing protein [Rickenella mellea]